MTGERPRLLVELNEEADQILELLSVTDGMNKSTIVTRAIQVYKMVTDAETVIIDGDQVKIR